MAKLEGDETNKPELIDATLTLSLQMLQNTARRRRWRNATSWLQVPDTTVRAC